MILKNKIISVLLSVVIFTTIIIQPFTAKADGGIYVASGLFTLLMTTLAYSGYQIQSNDAAQYINEAFYGKYLGKDGYCTYEEFKEECSANDKEFKEFWTKKFPVELKDAIDYKMSSSGVKFFIKSVPAMKAHIKELTDSLPASTLINLGSLSSVAVPSLPFTLNNCYFPTLDKAEDYSHPTKTTPYIKIKVNRTSDVCTVRIKFDTKFNNEYYSSSLGQIISIGLPAGTDEFSIYNSNQGGNYDKINEQHWDSSRSHFDIFTIAEIVRPDNSNYSRDYSFTIDSTVGCTIDSLEICDSLWEIPFVDSSESLKERSGIWDNLGTIETTMDSDLDLPLDDSYSRSIGLDFPLDYTGVEAWENERDDVDIKTIDEVKEEEQEREDVENIELHMDGIYENSGKLTDKFPFCIPWDVAKCVEGFKRSADPKVNFKIPFPYVGSFNVNFDLSDYETPLSILRFFELLGFILGILILTRNHFTRG